MRKLAVLALLSTALFAQTPKVKLPGEDWINLFNGKDLTGWARIPRHEDAPDLVNRL